MNKKEKIVNEYLSGQTVISLSKKYGLSRERIYQFIRKNGNYRQISRQKKPLNGAEAWVKKKLENRKIEVWDECPRSYDILTKSGIKIEVKHRITPNSSPDKKYYSIGIYNKEYVDFVIVIVGEIEQNEVYIIPSKECPHQLSIPKNKIYKRHKRKKYLNKWKFITTRDKELKNCP
jgi:transposase-like protein